MWKNLTLSLSNNLSLIQNFILTNHVGLQEESNEVIMAFDAFFAARGSLNCGKVHKFPAI